MYAFWVIIFIPRCNTYHDMACTILTLHRMTFHSWNVYFLYNCVNKMSDSDRLYCWSLTGRHTQRVPQPRDETWMERIQTQRCCRRHQLARNSTRLRQMGQVKPVFCCYYDLSTVCQWNMHTWQAYNPEAIAHKVSFVSYMCCDRN